MLVITIYLKVLIKIYDNKLKLIIDIIEIAAVSDLKIFSLIFKGIMFFNFKIFSLSLTAKSPSGPINIHKGSVPLIFNLLLSEFKSPKIIFSNFYFVFKRNNIMIYRFFLIT